MHAICVLNLVGIKGSLGGEVRERLSEDGDCSRIFILRCVKEPTPFLMPYACADGPDMSHPPSTLIHNAVSEAPLG